MKRKRERSDTEETDSEETESESLACQRETSQERASLKVIEENSREWKNVVKKDKNDPKIAFLEEDPKIRGPLKFAYRDNGKTPKGNCTNCDTVINC
jgi:hypothetical protein